ncbi:MAG: sugar phosphate isomerase/epimerase family protein [Bacteroidota bacterium]|nr:sugar phosphate isomerase/epimerase family protein [Bacteroidota bacterium]
MQRRSFLKSSSAALVGAGALRRPPEERRLLATYCPTPSLNAYSFNDALLNGEMSLEQLFQFAAETGFTAVDLTAYYIPGYPEAPSDELLYEIKRKAFRKGMSFSGTGVRNDFTVTGPEKLAEEIEHVKEWIVAASKLGAPNIRVFDGKAKAGGAADPIRKQVVDAFRECALFGSRYGVNVAFQNHHDFLVNTKDIIDIIKKVDSGWFGLMLDTGSVSGSDPYLEIEKLIPYAVSWQLKEKVRIGADTVPVDFPRLMALIHKGGYQGFLPLETLGEGDPKEKVQTLFRNVSKYM